MANSGYPLENLAKSRNTPLAKYGQPLKASTSSDIFWRVPYLFCVRFIPKKKRIYFKFFSHRSAAVKDDCLFSSPNIRHGTTLMDESVRYPRFDLSVSWQPAFMPDVKGLLYLYMISFTNNTNKKCTTYQY